MKDKILKLLRWCPWFNRRPIAANRLVKNFDHTVEFPAGEKADESLAPGLYWAKNEGYKWWNMIVEIEGKAPFYRLIAWRLGTNHLVRPESLVGITLGPRLEPPK